MAYALLAGLPPIHGLYVSIFPMLFYMLTGTSKHLSIGTFAVSSILIATTIDKRMVNYECLSGDELAGHCLRGGAW